MYKYTDNTQSNFLSFHQPMGLHMNPENRWIKMADAEYALGNTRMAAGDTFDSENINTAIKLMIHMDSKEEAIHTISVLSKVGTIISPFRPHPEPDDAGCGSITKDRFGYTWIITCPNPEKK